jgi:hypothetical protein
MKARQRLAEQVERRDPGRIARRDRPRGPLGGLRAALGQGVGRGSVIMDLA